MILLDGRDMRFGNINREKANESYTDFDNYNSRSANRNIHLGRKLQ